MKIILLDNQIDIILDSLEKYSKNNPEKLQLIYSTYESLLAQKSDKSRVLDNDKNVTIKFKKVIDMDKHYIYNRGNDIDSRFYL